MDAYWFLKPDGSQSEVSACGNCGRVAVGKTNYDISEKCCTCYDCGKPLSEDERKTHSLYHRSCEQARRQKSNIARIEKATLVEDYDGPVALDLSWPSGGWGDGYFESGPVLAECCDEEEIAEYEFAFCCTESRITLDLDSILESASEEAHESARESLEGIDELRTAVDAFNKRNENVLSYCIDYGRKVRIPSAAALGERREQA